MRAVNAISWCSTTSETPNKGKPMKEDGQKKLNEGLSSEMLKKGLSSSNLQSGLGRPPAQGQQQNSDTANTSKNGK